MVSITILFDARNWNITDNTQANDSPQVLENYQSFTGQRYSKTDSIMRAVCQRSEVVMITTRVGSFFITLLPIKLFKVKSCRKYSACDV